MTDFEIACIMLCVGAVLAVVGVVSIIRSRGLWQQFAGQIRDTAVPGALRTRMTVRERFTLAAELSAALLGFIFLISDMAVIAQETGKTGALIELPEPYAGWTAYIIPVTMVLAVLTLSARFRHPASGASRRYGTEAADEAAPAADSGDTPDGEPDAKTHHLVSLSHPGPSRAAVVILAAGGLLDLLFSQEAGSGMVLLLAAGGWFLAARDSLTAETLSWDEREIRHMKSVMGIRYTTVMQWGSVQEASRYERFLTGRHGSYSTLTAGLRPSAAGLRIVYRTADGKRGSIELSDEVFPDMTDLYRALQRHGVCVPCDNS